MTATLSSPSVDEIIAKLGAQSTCDAGLTQDPWHFDTTKPSYGPGASMFDPLPSNAPRQQVLPEEYRNASDEELQERIRAAKSRLGKKLLILGHFYQRDEIICHADFVGDSFQLAKNATERPDADHIVFCGVHFMAETADILSTPGQTVTLPNLSAGCSMADMANIDQVEECWQQLGEICGTKPGSDGRQQIVPVTYMNSSAALKAFCGRNGGIVCTSSNAHAVLEWAFARGKRVLFIGSDGMSAAVLRRSDVKAPTLRGLMARGAWSLKARTILPSSSAANWASMFQCSGPEQNGYNEWNSRKPIMPPAAVDANGRFPDIFYRFRAARPNAKIGYAYGWQGMPFVVDTNVCDFGRRRPQVRLAESGIPERRGGGGRGHRARHRSLRRGRTSCRNARGVHLRPRRH